MPMRLNWISSAWKLCQKTMTQVETAIIIFQFMFIGSIYTFWLFQTRTELVYSWVYLMSSIKLKPLTVNHGINGAADRILSLIIKSLLQQRSRGLVFKFKSCDSQFCPFNFLFFLNNQFFSFSTWLQIRHIYLEHVVLIPMLEVHCQWEIMHRPLQHNSPHFSLHYKALVRTVSSFKGDLSAPKADVKYHSSIGNTEWNKQID